MLQPTAVLLLWCDDAASFEYDRVLNTTELRAEVMLEDLSFLNSLYKGTTPRRYNSNPRRSEAIGRATFLAYPACVG